MGNGMCVVGSVTAARALIDMEAQIRSLEREAYAAVLRAFKAQSDAITWVIKFIPLAYPIYSPFCQSVLNHPMLSGIRRKKV